MDKTTGSKISFMSDHPELGRLDSIDIYADDVLDGVYSYERNIFMCDNYLLLFGLINPNCYLSLFSSKCKLFQQEWAV